jgi:nitroreductase
MTDAALGNQPMYLAELIRSRRSIATFTDQPVTLELVQELLEIAVYAPNHRLTEPWRFIVIMGEGKESYAAIRRDMVLDSMRSQGENERQQVAVGTYRKFMDIPLYLLVALRRQEDPELDIENYAACCCVIQNFLLLAWERGLGTSWKTFKNDPRLRDYVGLDEDEIVVGIIHVGYPTDEERTGQRKSVAENMTLLNGNR